MGNCRPDPDPVWDRKLILAQTILKRHYVTSQKSGVQAATPTKSNTSVCSSVSGRLLHWITCKILGEVYVTGTDPWRIVHISKARVSCWRQLRVHLRALETGGLPSDLERTGTNEPSLIVGGLSNGDTEASMQLQDAPFPVRIRRWVLAHPVRMVGQLLLSFHITYRCKYHSSGSPEGSGTTSGNWKR